jgi:SUN domain-containing protein 1/2
VVTDEIKSLQSEISALAKTQDEFAILSASLKDVESKIAALADGKKKTGLLSKLSKKTDTKVTNKQLVELENAVATLEKTQTKFASLASSQISTLESTLDAISQQQSSALTAADLKSIQKAITALEKSQESFATTAQLQKVDASREIKALEEALAEILQSQHSFANSTAVEELETKVMALEARQNEKRGGMFKRSASTDTSVTNKQLKALEDAIAALTKSQADFATVTQLKESAQALSQQQAGALTAADLKGIQKAVASLEKSQNGFATTAQLQKLEVVTDEIKSLQSEISALAKTQDEFAILSASLKDVESKIAALADGEKKTGLLSKLSKKTDTKVTNKQLKALEDAIAALTKSQADFATVTQLKKVAATLDALKNVHDNYATTKLVKNLELKLNQVIKTSGGLSTTQTNLVELEQRAMERVESYIKTIPKDTSRKLTKHIEEASSLWFADRTGRQDFALASGGGRVVGHSQLSPFVGRGDGPITSVLSFLRSGVHPKSDEWLLTPSLEQPGDCIALHSSTGYVDVRLRQSVKVDAVTLEHANSLNAYDLHSAPRDVQVYGWHARKKSCKHSKPPKSLIPLGNYTYSINRGSVQTFDVVSPQTVDHVRLVVKNNQGHQKWTCLYRFRVHGVPERVEA